MSRRWPSEEAGLEGGLGKCPPISRAGFETRSKNRLILAATYCADCVGPVLLADFSFSISRNVSDRNFPGGTSSVSGP